MQGNHPERKDMAMAILGTTPALAPADYARAFEFPLEQLATAVQRLECITLALEGKPNARNYSREYALTHADDVIGAALVNSSAAARVLEAIAEALR